jgi:hypothetical protein
MGGIIQPDADNTGILAAERFDPEGRYRAALQVAAFFQNLLKPVCRKFSGCRYYSFAQVFTPLNSATRFTALIRYQRLGCQYYQLILCNR